MYNFGRLGEWSKETLISQARETDNIGFREYEVKHIENKYRELIDWWEKFENDNIPEFGIFKKPSKDEIKVMIEAILKAKEGKEQIENDYSKYKDVMDEIRRELL